jgi:hypothetical protein
MVKKKSTLSKRYQSSYASKGSGGSGKKQIMDWKKVDGDVTFFSTSEGKNRINIIPYTIKTKNHPLVKSGDMEIGDTDYVMDVYVHRGVGASEGSVICLKETYGKPCPICEQMALLRKQGKNDEAGDLKPSRRVFYNVENTKEPGKLQVFETSHYLFEKELIDEARDDEEGGFIDFADPVKGKEIKFRANKVKKNKYEFTEYKSFSFEDRDEPVSDELLESAISFDEIMIVPTYEEVEKMFYGTDDEDEDDEEEKPVKKSKHHDEDDDDEEQETSKKSKKSVEDDDDEDDEEEKPSKKSKSKSKSEDDDWDDDEDEKPVKKSKKSSKEDDEDEEQEEKPKKKKSDDDWDDWDD